MLSGLARTSILACRLFSACHLCWLLQKQWRDYCHCRQSFQLSSALSGMRGVWWGRGDGAYRLTKTSRPVSGTLMTTGRRCSVSVESDLHSEALRPHVKQILSAQVQSRRRPGNGEHTGGLGHSSVPFRLPSSVFLYTDQETSELDEVEDAFTGVPICLSSGCKYRQTSWRLPAAIIHSSPRFSLWYSTHYSFCTSLTRHHHHSLYVN